MTERIMKIEYNDRTEFSYWGNIDFDSNDAAKKARDEEYRSQKKAGRSCSRWTLPGQIRKYAGFGQPDGRCGTVYYLNVKREGA